MANTLHYLTPILNQNQSPYYRQTISGIAGDDTHIFFGGKVEIDYEKTVGIWEIVACTTNIVTDATVANRYNVVGVGAQGGIGQDSVHSVAITASQTVCTSVKKLNVLSNMLAGTVAVALDYYAGLAKGWGQFAGEQEYFISYLNNGKAGDTYSIDFVLKCMNLELGIVPDSMRKKWFNL